MKRKYYRMKCAFDAEHFVLFYETLFMADVVLGMQFLLLLHLIHTQTFTTI